MERHQHLKGMGSRVDERLSEGLDLFNADYIQQSSGRRLCGLLQAVQIRNLFKTAHESSSQLFIVPDVEEKPIQRVR